MLVNNLNTSIMDNNFERAYYYFGKIKNLNDEYNLDDRLIVIADDLFKCFNYIVEHPNLDLTNLRVGEYRKLSNKEIAILYSLVK